MDREEGSSMTSIAVYNVYVNLHRFMEHRGMTPRDEMMAFDKFVEHMGVNSHGRIISKAERGEGPFLILLVYPLARSQPLSKLGNPAKLAIQKEMKASHSTSCLFVSDFLMEKSMVGKVLSIEESMKKEAGFDVMVRTYDPFLFDLSKRRMGSKHTVLSPAEFKEYAEKNYVQEESICRILETDPEIIWLGARARDTILIERTSPITLMSFDYRRVVPLVREK